MDKANRKSEPHTLGSRSLIRRVLRLLCLTLLIQLVGSPAFAFSLFTTTLDIVATPESASIYRRRGNKENEQLILLGTGRAKLKLELEKGEAGINVVVKQEGYRDANKSFSPDEDFPNNTFTFKLTDRFVTLTTLPYDAKINVNGEFRGTKSLELDILEGQTKTVELKKDGFDTISKTYRWEKGAELPPLADKLELTDRKVAVTSAPDGVELYSNDTKIGVGDADLKIRRGTCVKLIGKKVGWISESKDICNKEGLDDPKIREQVTLKGRTVNITAPEGARVSVNEKFMANGNFLVQIPSGSCHNVKVSQPGYLSFIKEYCVKPGEAEPEPEENVNLKIDGSYAASVASDQANVNFTIEVGKNLKEEQAWKLLSSIVLNYFDVLDNSDSQTGYLRSAWIIKTWGDSSSSTATAVRTRVIMKRINDAPLRYSLKIVTEKSKEGLRPGWSTKDDENFYPWDRILNSYKDLINEAQTRLK